MLVISALSHCNNKNLHIHTHKPHTHKSSCGFDPITFYLLQGHVPSRILFFSSVINRFLFGPLLFSLKKQDQILHLEKGRNSPPTLDSQAIFLALTFLLPSNFVKKCLRWLPFPRPSFTPELTIIWFLLWSCYQNHLRWSSPLCITLPSLFSPHHPWLLCFPHCFSF